MIKKLSAALVGATFVLAGCNTMSGMGQDIKAGGEKLEKKAEDVSTARRKTLPSTSMVRCTTSMARWLPSPPRP